MRVVTASEMREMDRVTIEELGIPGVVLMEHAGKGCVQAYVASMDFPHRVACLSGTGNNGGDGFVIARLLAQRGYDPLVVVVGDEAKIKGDALVNYEVIKKLPMDRMVVESDDDLPALREALDECVGVVDALFGTGLNADVRGIYREVIDLVEELEAFVLAVDIPSGISSDTGAVMGTAVKADVTVTFGAAKLGHVLYPGSEHTGELVVEDISIPRWLLEGAGVGVEVLEPFHTATVFPRRDRSGHKGDYGKVLVVAGAPGKGGAALLTGLGALRVGAGLVTVATDEATQARLEGRVPELMVDTYGPRGGLEPSRMEALLADKDVVVVGPGIGNDDHGAALLDAVVRGTDAPLVLDADALNVLARGGIEADLRADERVVVVTPHPGEMARLAGCSTAQVQADRLGVARAYAREHGVVVVLKGYRTIIAHPDGSAFISTTGNPGMATAGSGDVLGGVMAGLVGMSPFPLDAITAAVYVHGLAGDLAAEELGEPGLVASDLLDALPHAIRALQEG